MDNSVNTDKRVRELIDCYICDCYSFKIIPISSITGSKLSDFSGTR